jgi:hypothetical protein
MNFSAESYSQFKDRVEILKKKFKNENVEIMQY